MYNFLQYHEVNMPNGNYSNSNIFHMQPVVFRLSNRIR